MQQPCVYLLVNVHNDAVYVGVTSDLTGRTLREADMVQAFRTGGGLTRLVWVERHPTMASALRREARIQRWTKSRKLDLIDAANPQRRDLWLEIEAAQSGARTPDFVIPAQAGVTKLAPRAGANGTPTPTPTPTPTFPRPMDITHVGVGTRFTPAHELF